MNLRTDTSQSVRDLVDEALRQFGRGGKLNLWQEGPHSTGGVTQAVHRLVDGRQDPPDSVQPAAAG